MLSWWTIGKATGFGTAAGLAALLLWPVYTIWQDRVLAPFVVSLAIAAFCGLSILLITAGDMLTHQRGESLRPVRAFDIVLGVVLSVPTLIQLNALLSWRAA
jgi:drug/metabolite transporter (DMT)-like permease